MAPSVLAAPRTALICAVVGPPSRRRVCGLDLATRALLAARQAGCWPVLLAPAAELPGWQQRLATHPKLADGGWSVQASEPLRAGGPLELPSAVEQVVLAPADRIWLPRLLGELLALPAAADPSAPPLPHALLAAGPQAPGSAAEFGGLVRLPLGELSSLLPALLGGSGPLLTALDVAGRPPQLLAGAGAFLPLEDDGAVRRAEKMLLRSLIKPADGVVSRHINRKISLTLTRLLCRTAVRPNHVTAVVLTLGLASGPAAALGNYWGLALGGLLYYLGAILDGCDGELSRLKSLGTPLGTWFDTVTDDLSALSYLGGLYLGLSRQFASAGMTSLWLGLGAVAIGGNLLTVLLRYRILVRLGSGDHQKLARAAARTPTSALGRALAWVKQTVIRTDFLPFAAFVLSLCGVPWVFAAPYPLGAVGAVIDSVALTLSFRPSPAAAPLPPATV